MNTHSTVVDNKSTTDAASDSKTPISIGTSDKTEEKAIKEDGLSDDDGSNT